MRFHSVINIDEDGIFNADIYDADNGHKHICSVYEKKYLHILVATPDMIDELKNIVEPDIKTWDDSHDFMAWAQSRASFALAKAEGGE